MWQERFEKYRQTPEFNKINYDMTLAEFKPIFMWEYVHRLIGRTMMYVFAVGFIIFLIRKKITREMWVPFFLLFLMGAMQAVIGWWMVYSGLQQQPAVSHYRLATHLMSAFTLFAFTFWFALRLSYPFSGERIKPGKKLTATVIVFFIVLVIQIIYGAFTAGFVEGDDAHIRPGHIFNTWPKMGDQWVAEQVTLKPTLWQNIFENASGIQFMHRTIAVVIVVLVCVIWYKSNKLRLTGPQHLGVTLLIYGVTVQFMLGVLTLLYQVPVILGALHQTGAFFLFASAIFLIYHLIYNNSENLERTT